MVVKTIAKTSLFSLLGVIMYGWLFYTFLSLWLHPQASDAEMIYSLTILILFEFILVHSGVFMSTLGRSWKGWLGFIFLYGLFALSFNALVSGNQIIILYGAVVLNRMLPGLLSSEKADKERGLMLSAVYAIIYFALLFSVILGASYIPRCGLTEAFLTSVDYLSINQAGGDFAGAPHVFMCFGTLYYLILMFVEVNTEIHRVKAALAPSASSGQAIIKQPKSEENEQEKSTVFHQFVKDDGKQPPGCGCSLWLVCVLAAVLLAIGVYQHAEISKDGINIFLWLGIIILLAWAGLMLISKLAGKLMDKVRDGQNLSP